MLKNVFIFICTICPLFVHSIEIVSPMEANLYAGQTLPGSLGDRSPKIFKITEEFIKVSTEFGVIYYRYPVLFDPKFGFSEIALEGDVSEVKVGDVFHHDSQSDFVVSYVKKFRGDLSISVMPCGRGSIQDCDSLRRKLIERKERKIKDIITAPTGRKVSLGSFIINPNSIADIKSDCALELCIGDEVAAVGRYNGVTQPVAIGRIVEFSNIGGDIRYSVDFELPWSDCTFKQTVITRRGLANMPFYFYRSSLFKVNEQYDNKEMNGSNGEDVTYTHARIEDIYYIYSYEPWDKREHQPLCPDMNIQRL